jgi:glycosyltransferase involved in cell wall biosynthesis
MNIGYFNARGFNEIEHWFQLEIQELTKRGHDVINFSIRGNQPTKEHIEWMDFAHFHFAQVADRYKRIGVPFCISPHANDIWIDNGETLKRASKHPLCKFVTYQSFYHKRKFEEWGIDKPLVYLPMCARTTLFQRTSDIPNGEGIIIAGGRLIPKKGLDRIMHLDNLTIFGEGPLEKELKDMNPNVIFTGQLDGGELRYLMEKSWLFLHPAIITPDGDKDGIPNTIKEALLMRMQVIASPISGIPELEGIHLLDNWSNIEEVITTIPKAPNYVGERYVRSTYSPSACIDRFLKAIDDYGGL